MESLAEKLARKRDEMKKDDDSIREIVEKYGGTLLERAQERIEKKIVETLVERMHCPLMNRTEAQWDCNKMHLRKGREAFCNNAGFINCPSYQAHADYWIQKRKEKK